MIYLFNVCFFRVFCSQYGLKQRLMDKSELDHVTQVIGYHPSYLEHFLKIQNFILRGDGPLPYAYRHYLAIMVSQASPPPQRRRRVYCSWMYISNR